MSMLSKYMVSVVVACGMSYCAFAQNLPPGGGGPHHVGASGTMLGTAGAVGDSTPAPDRPLRVRDHDEEALPFETIATLDIDDEDGWIGGFEIQMNAAGRSRSVGTVTEPENGFETEVTITDDSEIDPNVVPSPELTDVIIEGDVVYVYCTIASEPTMSIVIAGPWSGYSPRNTAGWGWLEYFKQAVRDVVGEQTEKVTNAVGGEIKEITEYYLNLAKEACGDRDVCEFTLKMSLKDGSVEWHFRCCDQR